MDTAEIYYVYIHRRNDTNEVFYVGKGKHRRAWSRSGRNKWWIRVVDKYGHSVEIVEAEMSEESAYDLEAELIKFYRECGHVLCNLTDGGGGASGCVRSDETRKRVSEAMRKVHKEKGIWTPERRMKISLSHKANPKMHGAWRETLVKTVLCSNGLEFRGLQCAVNWLKENGWPKATCTGVSACCNGIYSSAYGYTWSFAATIAEIDKNPLDFVTVGG